MSEKANKENSALCNLLEVMRSLRHPKSGCEWDLQQTPKSLIPYLIEETYELVEAIQHENSAEVLEELGDLLFQIIFQTHLFEERQLFTIVDVLENISDKMKRRHPHIFGQKKKRKSVHQQKRDWQKIKELERKEKGCNSSPFSNTYRFLPALNQSLKMQGIASDLGVECENTEQALEKVFEETDEVKKILNKKEHLDLDIELGDLFFSVITVTRLLGKDPESCLRLANKKFTARCEKFLEIRENKNNENLNNPSTDEEIWEKVKSLEDLN